MYGEDDFGIPRSFVTPDDSDANKSTVEELEQIILFEFLPDRKVYLGTGLTPELRRKLIEFLQANADCFAWSHTDMTGISPEIASHKLSLDGKFRPVKQKRRPMSEQKHAFVKDEVTKLLNIGSIREVKYPDWLANVVVVPKKGNKFRMCVDYKDLNKACPKDSFPLPHIDRMIDATAGHEMLSFLDAYSGYNQIRMHPEDQEKTSFITRYGTYCYNVMPFGLKNAGATYQRLVNEMFKEHIGKTMEVYIDDMVVKSLETEDHLKHLQETFDVLRRYNMKLNPEKCAFGVRSGKFLGFMVSNRGIEINPDKIKAIEDIEVVNSIKGVQRLTGRIAALSRFISRSSDKCHRFFSLLRKKNDFVWTPECQGAL